MAHPDYYETYTDNLKSQEYIDFNIKVAQNYKQHLAGSLWWNLSYNKNQKWEWMEIFLRIMKDVGMKLIDTIVWDKGHGMPITSKDALTRQYESIAVFEEDNDEREIGRTMVSTNGKFRYYKIIRGLTNYWRIGTFMTQRDGNLACFPVAVPLRAITIATEGGGLIADPFLGTGSTLIACEKTNRICYGMEIDPN